MKQIVAKKIDIMKSILFNFFLYPITVGVFSVNYCFILYPFFSFIRCKCTPLPPVKIILIMGGFVLILLGGLLSNPLSTGENLSRILISFAVFMSIFSFNFVKIDKNLTELFKYALISISCLFSAYTFFKFLYYGGNLIGYSMKDVVGSQRCGFIYILGFFSLFYLKVEEKYNKILRVIGLWLIFMGIVLTFSRASIVSFVVALGLYYVVQITKIRSISLNDIIKNTPKAIMLILSFVVLYKLFPLPFDFFSDRILDRYFFKGTTDFLASETSEGSRLRIWGNIFSHILQYPLTGSVYMGTWISHSINAGSAHNQYMDILFRTGILGFLMYMYLIFNSLFFLRKEDKGLFWGMLGILVYGFFHETFKESNGAFVLAFVLGMYVTHIRQLKVDSPCASKKEIKTYK